jgi:hypothetical protein
MFAHKVLQEFMHMWKTQKDVSGIVLLKHPKLFLHSPQEMFFFAETLCSTLEC